MAHEKKVLDPATGEMIEVNDNFIQIYVDHISVLSQMIQENGMAARIFMWLVQHMDKRNALVISQQTLAEQMGIHRNSVSSAIKYLREIKAMDIVNTGNSKVFAINAQIMWQSGASKKKFAWFDAKVFVSESEQFSENEDAPVLKTNLIGHPLPKKGRGRPAKIRKTASKQIADFENA
jgi:DNA-binding transcriptional regulator YhcF (GntR family)